MKVCPSCQHEFSDSDDFCPVDGSSLISSDLDRGNVEAAPTILTPGVGRDSPVTKSQSSLKWLVLTVGVLAGVILILGFLVLRTYWTDSGAGSNFAQTDAGNSNNENKGNDSKISDAEIRSFLSSWEAAQDRRDFSAYSELYDNNFEGVKRTKAGAKQVMNRNQWLSDRKTMMANAKGLDIELKNITITISDLSGTAKFDQYYRSSAYSDWGPKIIRVRKTSDENLKVFYEELKDSFPLK